MLPVWYFRFGRSAAKSWNILAAAYGHPAFNDSWMLGTFIVHMVAGSFLALVATQIIHHVSVRNKTATETSTKYFFTFTVVVAVFIAVLTQLEIPIPYILAAMIPLVGYAASSVIIGWSERIQRTTRETKAAA